MITKNDWNRETYERLRRLPTPDDERDLCDFIAHEIDNLSQEFAKLSNDSRAVGLKDLADKYYWRSMMLSRAMEYAIDWKEGV